MIQIKKSSVATALGAVVIGSLASTAAMANTNPFAMQALESGYSQFAADTHGGAKDKEGKCGGDKAAKAEGKCGEGKCGGDKAVKAEGKCGEGKCGGDKAVKAEGKCGEGKCGGDKAAKADKTKEGKCGEGKCGSM